MTKLFTFIFCLLLVPSLYGQQLDEETARLIEIWLDAQKDYEKLPGISAIAINDQDVVWKGATGMANPEANVSTTTATLGSICSISKLFTSLAVMKLYEEGKLRLDDRIEDLLPWYDLKQHYADSGPVTVRSLLTHSSGLPRESNHPYWTGPDFPFPSTEDVREGLSDQETLYPASTYFQYSNLGLTLLGEIVKEVSGQDYDTYIRENILTPLGLENTRTELPESMYGDQLAIGYSAINRAGERTKVNFFQAEGIKAAAGYTSNVEDLGTFASWQFRLLDTTEAEVLQPSTLRYMQTVHWVDPDFGVYWGLGFSVSKGNDGNKWVGHGGSCPGYRSTVYLNTETKQAYAVMINASGTNPSKYAQGIHALIKKAAGTKKEEGSESDFTEYTGFYNTFPWSSESYIGQLHGKLYTIYLPADNPAEAMTMYKHIEGDTFRRIRDNGELGEAMTFERNEAGEITRLMVHNNYRNKIRRDM